MARAGIPLLILTLLLPVVAAQAADAPAVEEPALPDRLADAAATAGSALASGAGAAASAAAGGASAVGSALVALGGALASLASGLASAVGSALAAIGSALAALGGSLASLAATAGGALAALAGMLASLLGSGARAIAAHPKESAIVAGSATGGITLAWLLKRFGAALLVPLYTRLAPSEMLDNEARARVYEHVRATPGAHPSGIAAALGLGWGTVIYHLGKLESSSLVVAKTANHKKCYFATGSALGADARAAVAAMTHDKAKLIVNAVHAAPGITQKQLAERVGMSQALMSWHVKRLVTSGVLLTAREGRSNALRVAAHVPMASAAVAA